MDVYMYQATRLCEECGEEVIRELTAQGRAPSDPEDEGSYDSDEFPKGPYANGGGEADCPQSCDHCFVFLENSLTTDGYEYVREEVKEATEKGRADSVALTEWAPFYGISLDSEGDKEDCFAAARPQDQ